MQLDFHELMSGNEKNTFGREQDLFSPCQGMKGLPYYRSPRDSNWDVEKASLSASLHAMQCHAMLDGSSLIYVVHFLGLISTTRLFCPRRQGL